MAKWETAKWTVNIFHGLTELRCGKTSLTQYDRHKHMFIVGRFVCLNLTACLLASSLNVFVLTNLY